MLNHPPLEQEESVEDLLASIRSLVYPNSLKDAQETGSPKDQLKETLSSFTKIVQEKSHPFFQKTIEGFLAEAVKDPLKGLLKEAEPMILMRVESYIQDHLPALLTQWMDTRLPGLVKECVTDYLENLKTQG
jgi:hypothetical protein